MMGLIEKLRRFLWAFVEIAFLLVLALILAYLILGANSGSYVQAVADNVMKLAGAIPTPSLIGLGIVGLLIYLIAQRVKS